MVIVFCMRIPTFLKKLNSLNPYETIKKLRSHNRIMSVGDLRPYDMDYTRRYTNYVVPVYQYPLNTLYTIAFNSDILTSVHNAIRRELFRNGIELVKAEQTDSETTSTEAELPEEQQGISEEAERKSILEWLDEVNENQQKILDVLFELEDDFSIMDDAFMVFLNSYKYNKEGVIVEKELQEVLRADPKFMGLVMNKQDRPAYDDDGHKLSFCPCHREQILTDTERCKNSDCGLRTLPAHFRHHAHGHELFYTKNEVVHKNKYRPSKRLGYSPILAIYNKTFTLNGMDEYMLELYAGKRPPKGLLIFNTSNVDAAEKAFEKMQSRALENPQLPGIMAIESKGDKQPKKVAEFIDFMRSLDELQYTDTRNEMRRQIGAVYGVMPLWQGDMSQGGGLNNEGMQITVTNRATEYGQGIYNDYFLTKLLEAKGVKGWILRLRPSEEQDKKAKLERTGLNLDNARKAVELGLPAEWDEDSGDVVIKSGVVTAPVTSGGDMGGFGGDPFSLPASGAGSSGLPSSSSASGAPRTVDPVGKGFRRPAFGNFRDLLQGRVDKVIGKGRKLSKKQLEDLKDRLGEDLSGELKNASNSFFRKAYDTGMNEVGRDLGVNIGFDAVDQNALDALQDQAVLSSAFKGLTQEVTGNVQDIIREAFETPKGLDATEIAKRIEKVAGITDARAETIARTEIGKVSAAARGNSYKKSPNFDSFKFKHSGPNDRRTTDTSKRIKKATRDGVGWDEYVRIVTEESAKDFPEFVVDPDAPLSHYSSRHRPLRMVGPP